MNGRRVTSALAGLLVAGVLSATPPAVAGPTAVGRADEPTPEPTSEPAEVGSWTVTEAGPDSWRIAWRAPERLPVAADRPTIVAAEQLGELPAGAPLGVPTVAEDGRTVEVTVTSSTGPTPEELDVVLSGDVLDEGVPVTTSAPGTDRWTEPERELLPVDPGVAGTLPTTTSDYELAGIQVPRMREDVEMVGHVVEPAPEAADPSHPLVLFLHGRHSYCYNPDTGRLGWRWPCAGQQEPIPSQLGYDYIQELLASQGYVTVSIAANGINAQDGSLSDGGAAGRSQLIQAHLDQWADWSTAGEHEVDLDKVVLVGHSRGGEGASRASLDIPLTAPYRIVGQVLIGPTNFGRQTTPYVPTVTVLPSCDGDVSDLQGQAFTDLALGLATGDTAMKSSILSVGANHNFFNTEWTPGISAAPSFDDWGLKSGACGNGAETRLTAGEQRDVGKAYVAGAVHLFADGEQDYRPMFDGSAVRVGSTGPAVVLSHMVGGDREFRVPGEDANLTTPVGAEAVLCEGTTPFRRTQRDVCGKYVRRVDATPHWPGTDSLIPLDEAFQLSWEASGGTGGLVLDSLLDLTGRDWLDLRTVVDPKIGDVSLQVRVTDQEGASVVVDPVSGGDLPALPRASRFSPGKHWAQTLRVATADLAGIDTSEVTEVEFVGLSDRGRLWVLDLAAVTAPLPAVPVKRVPIVDLGRVQVEEGGPGTHLAELPFSVTGEVTDPAELWVYGYDLDGEDEPVRVEVELAPGSDDGTIAWEYEGDNRDSFPRAFRDLIGHAVHNVMMRDNEGRIIVLDDDPPPTVSFRAVRPRAEEGSAALFEVTLSEPTDMGVSVGLDVVPGDGSADPVRAHDIAVRWLQRRTNWKAGTDPALHELQVRFWRFFRAGQTTKVFEIPIRDDSRTEPRESLTVRASDETGWRSAPTPVVVPASDG